MTGLLIFTGIWFHVWAECEIVSYVRKTARKNFIENITLGDLSEIGIKHGVRPKLNALEESDAA